jgi:hypothetical protein
MSNGREAAGLNELETALGSLTPRQPKLDRDAILYHAGRASIRRWQVATVVSTVTTALMAFTLLLRTPAERIILVPTAPSPSPEAMLPESAAPEPAAASAGSGAAFYFHLQEEVLNRGLDGLPPLPSGSDPADSASTEDFLRGL